MAHSHSSIGTHPRDPNDVLLVIRGKHTYVKTTRALAIIYNRSLMLRERERERIGLRSSLGSKLALSFVACSLHAGMHT